ncbi:MAG: hypothetical protein K6A69_04930 [Lachnospiraceae bacterium]|nr:hypothetical protein [Lachnospiraceae bacterium]
MDRNTVEVSGFLFTDEKLAGEADKELSAIKYIEKKMDTQSPELVLDLYNSLIDQEFFHTPVGIDFLRRIQKFLLSEISIDSKTVKPIPVSDIASEAAPKKDEYEGRLTASEKERYKKRDTLMKEEVKKYRQRNRYFIVASIALVIMVIAMFVITLTGNSPTILNYENAIIDKYSGWEEELEQREMDIRIRETELNKMEQTEAPEEAEVEADE